MWGDPVRGTRRPDKETRRDAEEGCMYVRDSTGVWGGERRAFLRGMCAWEECAAVGGVKGLQSSLAAPQQVLFSFYLPGP